MAMRELMDRIGDDEQVASLNLDELIARAEGTKQELAGLEKCVRGWRANEYEQLRNRSEVLMRLLQEDLGIIMDYYETMLTIKADLSADKQKQEKNFRGRCNTLAKVFEAGKVPKDIAKRCATQMPAGQEEQDGSEKEFAIFYPKDGPTEYTLVAGNSFERPAIVLYGDVETYHHGYLNTVWNSQHGTVTDDVPKAQKRLLKAGRFAAYKVLKPLNLSMNPPSASGAATPVIMFKTVADVTPLMFTQQAFSYAHPKAAALSSIGPRLKLQLQSAFPARVNPPRLCPPLFALRSFTPT